MSYAGTLDLGNEKGRGKRDAKKEGQKYIPRKMENQN